MSKSGCRLLYFMYCADINGHNLRVTGEYRMKCLCRKPEIGEYYMIINRECPGISFMRLKVDLLYVGIMQVAKAMD